MVQNKISFFQKYVVIEYFVGGLINPSAIQASLVEIPTEVKEEFRVVRGMGKGFFQIVTKSRGDYTKNLDALTSHFQVGQKHFTALGG